MHESDLARRVVEAVLEATGGARVVSVKGTIAEAETLSPDSLGFHFAAHAKGTQAEGARLELDLVEVLAICDGCGKRFMPEDHHVLLCPDCGSPATLEAEVGVRVTAVEVEDD